MAHHKRQRPQRSKREQRLMRHKENVGRSGSSWARRQISKRRK